MAVKIAFIGLGSMGGRMTERLLEAGVEVSVFDVVPERMQAFEGRVRIASSIADAIQGVDGIFSVVPADYNTHQVVGEIMSAGTAGQVYVDFSTIGPWTITPVAQQLDSVGVITISAGMTRSIGGAEEGTLSLYIGGVDEIPANIKPAFDCLASDLTFVGEVGAAKTAKLVNNMIVTAMGLTIHEGLALAKQFGISYRTMVDGIIAAGGTSWTMDNHTIAHVLTGNLGTGFFSTTLVRKDMRLVTRLCEELLLPACFIGLSAPGFRGACAAGHGDDYHPITVHWMEDGGLVGHRKTTPLPSGMDQAAVVSAIAQTVVDLQAIASAEGLNALGRTGIDPMKGARMMDAGTAGNGALDRFMAGQTDGPLYSEVQERLRATSAICDVADMPGTTFEVSRHRVLAAQAKYGVHASVWVGIEG